jgi:hypothetical protein
MHINVPRADHVIFSIERHFVSARNARIGFDYGLAMLRSEFDYD